MLLIQPAKERLTSIDGLRGFAIFGILLVNIFIFHGPYPHYFEFYGSFTGANATAFTNMSFFCGGKFMFIFAFLFGYGCWMQYEKYEDHSAFQNFWIKRMLFLALFGIVHVLLFSWGDILLPYALLGMTLPFIIRLSNFKLFILFVLVYYIPVWEFVLRPLLDYESIFMSSKYSLKDYLSINGSGNFIEIFKLRLYDYFSFQNEKLIMYIPKEWSLFIVGIVASRMNLVRTLTNQQGIVFSLMAFVFVSIWYFFSSEVTAFFNLESSVQRIVFGGIYQDYEFVHGALYIIVFLMLWRLPIFEKAFSFLRFVGKMSLTNYLLQSFICAIIFSGYGFGYYGQLTPIQLLLTALVIFAAQAILSYFWLCSHKFGPMEGFWRKLTYGFKLE